MRAYSIASPNWEEHLEFFSIKVPDGPLTSQLQHLKEGDEIIISKKPTGTLVLDDLKPGKHLYLLSTGTGLAPFMSVIQDPETYERFEKVILCHGVRYVNEVAYREFITEHLPQNEFFGESLRDKLIYYPTVTRVRERRSPDRPDAQRQTIQRHRPASDQPAGRPRHAVRQPEHARRDQRSVEQLRPESFAADARAG
jgi:ferredoxin--NADP+ reductase